MANFHWTKRGLYKRARVYVTEESNRCSSGEPLGMNVDALWLEALLWIAFLAAVGLGAVGILGNGQLVYHHLPKMQILFIFTHKY